MMSLKIGIVGLPNVGKSTLFKALTKQGVEIANYPFATIEPNVGVVPVPDERLQKLAEFSRSKKVVPAVVEFIDIAGLVKGAAEGEGLGNKFLTHIREVDAIAEVVRVFENKDIIHVSGTPRPCEDIDTVEYELILKDLETVEKRLGSVGKDVRAQKKGAEEETKVLNDILTFLKSGRRTQEIADCSNASVTTEEWALRNCNTLKTLQLLTAKPIIYVFNFSEEQTQKHWEPDQELQKKVGTAPYVVISAKIEAELADLGDEERKEFVASLGIEENGFAKLIRVGYETLGLITYFTTGEDETRAWTIPRDSSAPHAGRAIHSDFEEKFIRAEIIPWQTLINSGSFAQARETGKIRTEGKEYKVKDGDVIEFKI